MKSYLLKGLLLFLPITFFAFSTNSTYTVQAADVASRSEVGAPGVNGDASNSNPTDDPNKYPKEYKSNAAVTFTGTYYEDQPEIPKPEEPRVPEQPASNKTFPQTGVKDESYMSISGEVLLLFIGFIIYINNKKIKKGRFLL